MATAATTAFDQVIDALRAEGKIVRTTGTTARAQCPTHDGRSLSLAIYCKPGRAKIICYAGCDDRGVLAALGLDVPDLFDEPRMSLIVGNLRPRPRPLKHGQPKSRIDSALEQLLSLPDFGERLCLGIARTRPELYIWEREQLGGDLHE